MDAERWRRLSELYHEAAAHEEKERAAFLADACAGDVALRHKVQSLLDSRGADDGFLAEPALAVAAQMVSDPAASVPASGRTAWPPSARIQITFSAFGEAKSLGPTYAIQWPSGDTVGDN